MQRNINDISGFFLAGINYKKTEASIRGLFAINTDQYKNILALAPQKGIDQLFILSTCNRTEIYGFAESASSLVELLCSQTTGDRETFEKLAYIKSGTDVVDHLFNVGGGLEVSVSLRELTEVCREVVGGEVPVTSNPETSPVDIPFYVSDAGRVRERFGWRPERGVRAIVSEIHQWLGANEAALRPLFT